MRIGSAGLGDGGSGTSKKNSEIFGTFDFSSKAESSKIELSNPLSGFIGHNSFEHDEAYADGTASVFRFRQ